MGKQAKITMARTDLEQRLEPIDDLGGRTEFERDYTAILYSHAFRRLKHKTQVFFFPVDDHICTRLDHSLYVAAISSVICRNFTERGIPCDATLASAIGIGHDLGHPPFGHAGEVKLNELARPLGGFRHETHGLRVVDKLEKPRSPKPVVGLNLTLAVRDGIAHHCGENRTNCLSPSTGDAIDFSDTARMPRTIEGCIVRLVDKVTYLGRDIEDAIIAEKFTGISERHLPAEITAKIGSRNGEIVQYFVKDIINSSSGDKIRLSDPASALMAKMMDFNYSEIYQAPRFFGARERVGELVGLLFEKLMRIVCEYYDNLKKYDDASDKAIKILGKFIEQRRNLYFDEEQYPDNEARCKRIVVDWISTLTDRFAYDAFASLFLVPHQI